MGVGGVALPSEPRGEKEQKCFLPTCLHPVVKGVGGAAGGRLGIPAKSKRAESGWHPPATPSASPRAAGQAPVPPLVPRGSALGPAGPPVSPLPRTLFSFPLSFPNKVPFEKSLLPFFLNKKVASSVSVQGRLTKVTERV